MSKPHACMACPLEVRSLYATAANLVVAVRMALDGESEPARVRRKLDELEEAVATMAPIVAAHFEAR